MTVTSGALLATLSASKSDLDKDALLTLIAGLAPQLQLTVQVDTSKTSSPTQLELYNGTKVTQRNAILRTLCSFFHQMDCMPLCLMGGAHAYGNAATHESQACLASVSSWMSYASSLASHVGSSSEQIQTTLTQLNDYLSTRAFLVPSPMATLADLSVYFAMLDVSISGDFLSQLPHLQRWWYQLQSTVATLKTGIMQKASTCKWIEQNAAWFAVGPVTTAPPLAPIFFYGHEDTLLMAAAVAIDSSAVVKAPTKIVPAVTVANASTATAPTSSAPQATSGGLSEEQKKAAAEKKAKKNAEKSAKKEKAGDGAGGADTAEYDITALEIRVGHIIKAWNHETADKLYCEEIDLGPELGIRQIASGLRLFYNLEEMQNRQVLVLCNLKARNLVGFPSHGMVMCASNADHTSVEFVTAPPEAKLGERVAFEGFDASKPPEAEAKMAKKKVFEKVAPDLKTDSEGNVVWKGAKATTSAGVCYATNKMPNAQVA